MSTERTRRARAPSTASASRGGELPPPSWPIQLVAIDIHDSFVVVQSSLEALERYLPDHKVIVTSVCGAFRKGKSSLMNHLAVKHLAGTPTGSSAFQGFKTSHTTDAVTKGLWVAPFITDSTVHLLIDCEGFRDPGTASQQRDLKLFCLALLTSSQLIWNGDHTIAETELQDMASVVCVSSMITQGGNEPPLGQARLCWVLRDFFLDLPSDITDTNAYLESALEARRSLALVAQAANNTRSIIKQIFPARSCHGLPRATPDPAVLDSLGPKDSLRACSSEYQAALCALQLSLEEPRAGCDVGLRTWLWWVEAITQHVSSGQHFHIQTPIESINTNLLRKTQERLESSMKQEISELTTVENVMRYQTKNVPVAKRFREAMSGLAFIGSVNEASVQLSISELEDKVLSCLDAQKHACAQMGLESIRETINVVLANCPFNAPPESASVSIEELQRIKAKIRGAADRVRQLSRMYPPLERDFGKQAASVDALYSSATATLTERSRMVESYEQIVRLKTQSKELQASGEKAAALLAELEAAKRQEKRSRERLETQLEEMRRRSEQANQEHRQRVLSADSALRTALQEQKAVFDVEKRRLQDIITQKAEELAQVGDNQTRQIEGLTRQVQSLQADVSRLQTQNAELQRQAQQPRQQAMVIQGFPGYGFPAYYAYR